MLKSNFDLIDGKSIAVVHYCLSRSKRRYSDIPDDEFDVFVGHIIDLSPQLGERMLLGSLQAQGIKVQRRRLR